jgi:hypothetical protein
MEKGIKVIVTSIFFKHEILRYKVYSVINFQIIQYYDYNIYIKLMTKVHKNILIPKLALYYVRRIDIILNYHLKLRYIF